MNGVNLVDAFRRRLEEAGCSVVVAPDPAAAGAELERIHGPAAAACVSSPLVDLVRRVMAGWTFTSRADEAGVGVFEADLGIADTGTLAFSSPDPALRMASTLPPVAVALVRRDRVVPSLDDVIERCGGPVLTLITGPSSTGDIEGVPAVGVHGPAEMTVVIVGEVAP